jgi:uncharacterized protein YbjQ (UPF0145 family)
MKRLTILIVLVVGLLLGCVTTSLTPAGSKVRVTTNPEAVKGCKYLGEVMGRDRMNGGTAGQWAAEENADNRFKNRAAEMGANTVLMITAQTNTSGAVKRGEAYACEAATLNPPSQ